jgi:hypothetical protein
MDKTDAVLIPREVVERALWKARIEYSRVTGRGRTPSPPNECWSEFLQLAGYLRQQQSTETDVVLIPREVVERAFWKARIEYSNALGRGRTPSRPNECWSEFLQLAEYLRRQKSTGDQPARRPAKVL